MLCEDTTRRVGKRPRMLRKAIIKRFNSEASSEITEIYS